MNTTRRSTAACVVAVRSERREKFRSQERGARGIEMSHCKNKVSGCPQFVLLGELR